jgi:hypothetical protein
MPSNLLLLFDRPLAYPPRRIRRIRRLAGAKEAGGN